MRKPLVAGNWKMHGSNDQLGKLLGGIIAGVDAQTVAEILVCPAFLYLPAAAALLKGTPVKLGAQNACDQQQGAYTGEIAPGMLAEVGCEYVLLGHSERRALYGESSEQVAAKFSAALAAGLKPVLCVGESLQEREAGQTEQVVGKQLSAILDTAGAAALADAVVAYEPVWAIGTGLTASPQQAQEIHEFIRRMVASKDANIAGSLRILYGGSVKPGNAVEIFSMPDVDGGLIGGASLKSEDFLAIVNAAGT